MKNYNKLVRDNIPQLIKEDDINCKFHIAATEEFEAKLYEKLQEELVEFAFNPSAEEFADMLEVLDNIRVLHGLSLEEIRTVKLNKLRKKGSFKKRIVLDSTD